MPGAHGVHAFRDSYRDDGFGAADVYDVTVTLTCQNMAPTEGVTAGSTGSYNARISCAAQSQSTAQTTSYGFTNNVDSQSSCKMGRAEVYNPTARHPDGAGQGVRAMHDFTRVVAVSLT